MKPPNPREPVEDAAKRCADIVNSFLAFVPWDELKNKWLAIRLIDGGHDGTLYDSKRDAVRHQSDEKLCCYISYRNCAAGISAIEAQRFLDFNRAAYDAGFRLPDPDDVTGGPDLFMPFGQYDDWRIYHDRRFILPNLPYN
jgi:hypothetical protein